MVCFSLCYARGCLLYLVTSGISVFLEIDAAMFVVQHVDIKLMTRSRLTSMKLIFQVCVIVSQLRIIFETGKSILRVDSMYISTALLPVFPRSRELSRFLRSPSTTRKGKGPFLNFAHNFSKRLSHQPDFSVLIPLSAFVSRFMRAPRYGIACALHVR